MDSINGPEQKMELFSLLTRADKWYEVEITPCYTYVILRNKWGMEFKFYNDMEGMAEMDAFLV